MHYNIWADLLNKLHTAEPWIQATAIIMLGAVSLGACYFLKETVDYAGRRGSVGALVMGDEPLLCAIPMEDLDLVVIPQDAGAGAQSSQPEYPHFVSQVAAKR